MKKFKAVMSQELSILSDNIQRTGDPLGMRAMYWTEWAKGLGLPRAGETVVFTGRMYQMLPYVSSLASLLGSAQRVLQEGRTIGNIISVGNRLLGDQIIRLRANKEQKFKSTAVLRGIVKALSVTGCKPAYLYDDEPYSGALLYDLGLDGFLREHVNKVYSTLERHGVRQVICVDPHTLFMLREVYPKYINDYKLEIKHYIDVLLENVDELREIQKGNIGGGFVIHDSCFMARSLGIVEQPRKLLRSLGVKTLEPENTKLNTSCCGGPIEYAYPRLSALVSRERAEELARVSKNILVQCPFCLLNLGKYQQELGIKVLDLGEFIWMILKQGQP
ncbi:Lactate utilization protein A [subsurface metagenome]